MRIWIHVCARLPAEAGQTGGPMSERFFPIRVDPCFVLVFAGFT